ncbi:MAG: hypothetical protein M3P49_12420 [Actinomycetota bacterium]|nr:hypothetical protein [Actinomycetota bacterium]
MLEGLGSARPLIPDDPIVGNIPGATRIRFGGECSPEEIDRVAEAASENGADVLAADADDGTHAGPCWPAKRRCQKVAQ